MSVEPWMLACPRSAMIPPPGRPMFPSSACRIDAVRMYWAPTLCCVQPTEYTNAVVRSRPLLAVIHSATCAKASGSMPHTSATISGVYREKCRLSTWNTHRGSCRVSSRSAFTRTVGPPLPAASCWLASRTSGPCWPACFPWPAPAWAGFAAGLVRGPLTGRGTDRLALVLPRRLVVVALLGVEPGEQPVEVLGVLEVL